MSTLALPLTERVEQARVLSYQDPIRSLELAREALAAAEAETDESAAAQAGWLIALAEMRIGDSESGETALKTARRRFTELGDARGQRLYDLSLIHI